VDPVSLKMALGQDSPGEQRPLEDMTVVPQFQIKVRKGPFGILLSFLALYCVCTENKIRTMSEVRL